MIRLVVSNQGGGVAKTTTTLTLARYLADHGSRVLVIDTDPQGSIAVVLGLRNSGSLNNYLIKQHVFDDCLTTAHPNIDILISNRDTVQTESILMGQMARETTFIHAFGKVEKKYDAVLIDVAPSISLLQTCGILYAKNTLVPVSMDPLSLQGAIASIETTKSMGRMFGVHIRTVALLPVMVDRRFHMTAEVLNSLEDLAKYSEIPLLPAIRTDSAVTKAVRDQKFLIDSDPRCKAIEDYTESFKRLVEILGEPVNEQTVQVSA